MIHHSDHFIFKIMRLFVGSGFLVSHRWLCKPRHFYGLSTLGTMFDHNWWVFHSREDLFLLDDTQHNFFFTILINRATLLDVVPFNRAHPINTKRSVNSLTMHSHPFNAMSLCICNARCHCMSYHVTCIMNATWTTQSTPLTGCHRQSNHQHITSLHHFIHVNISYKHISIFTFNMSFYDQAMTHTQANHVMAFAHNHSSHVNMLEYSH